MSYIITLTTGGFLMALVDGTADGPDINPGLNALDINLFGKNYPSYGQYQNENFIKLLQNFSGNNAPTHPLSGELWYDTSTSVLRVYNGSVFRPVTSVLTSATTPTLPAAGDEWYDSVNQQLKIYTGSFWQVVGPSYSNVDGLSGPVIQYVYDTNNVKHVVTGSYSQGNLISINSYDKAFTPNVAITGFTTINPGITLNALNNGTLLYGTATNAQQLGNISSTNYARTDITTIFAANIFLGGGNASINTTSTGSTHYENTILNANISMFQNVNGTRTRTFHVIGTNGLATVSGAPTDPLGIATKGYVDSALAANVALLAPLASPSLVGSPTAPTVLSTDSSTKIATTAFVQSVITSSNSSLWRGSNKYVSTVPPTPFDGAVGDIWFQI